MTPKYQTPEQALDALRRELDGDIYGISKILGNIHPSHLYNYYMKYRKKPSPTLVRILRKFGYIPTRIRSQITWESREQKDAFEWYIKSLGNGSISEYCREIANSNMEAFKNGKNERNSWRVRA